VPPRREQVQQRLDHVPVGEQEHVVHRHAVERLRQPLRQAISADSEVSAVLAEACAPLTVKAEPGSVTNTACTLRSVLKSCAQASRPRNVTSEASSCAKARSVLTPSSVRDAVTSLPP